MIEHELTSVAAWGAALVGIALLSGAAAFASGLAVYHVLRGAPQWRSSRVGTKQ